MFSGRGRFFPKAIFFLPCYLYVWIFVEPHLIYHGFGTVIPDVPLFSIGWRFLKDSLAVPGGAVVYVHGFLSQWYYYSWLGALVVVLAALCLCELSRWHYAHVNHDRSTVLYYLPAVMILLAYNQYSHPLSACLASSTGLLFSLFSERIPLRKAPVRMAVFCLAAAASYCLAGAGGVLVFSLMTTVYLLVLYRDWVSAVLTPPAAAAIIWVLAEHVFHVSPKQAFLVLTPFSRDLAANMRMLSKALVVALYVFVPVAVLSVCLCRWLFNKAVEARAVSRSKTKSGRKGADGRPMAFGASFKKLVVPIAPVAVLAVGLYFSHDKVQRQIVLMNYLSRQERWPEVLELGKRMPKNIYNIYCNHDINRALYHAGRLAYDLLYFPQNPNALLLTHEQEESSMTQLKMCGTFMEIGNVNYAEKLACEFVVDKGDAGMMLEKLAWINIIKEQERTAQIYLNALKKDLVCRHRADFMLKGLKDGFEPEEAAHIRQIRSCVRSNGGPRLHKESIEEMLAGLLAHNPRNKMAFEYLMTFYLFAGQLEKIVANIERLDDLGYEDVPTLYEEAVLIYHGARGRQLDLKRFKIKGGTLGRYKRFVELCNSMQQHNRQAVLRQLMGEFGTSYFFYYYKLTTSAQTTPALS